MSTSTFLTTDNWLQKVSKERLMVFFTWIFLAAASWLLGVLVWKWYEAATMQPPQVVFNPTTKGTKADGLESLPDDLPAALFGKPPTQSAPAAPEELVEDAPETQLNLRLRGVFASDDPNLSSAIIEDERGEQAMYFVGDTIGNRTNVRLHKVLPHRVLIQRGNRVEALTMDDFADEKLLAKTAPKGTPGKRASGHTKLVDRTRDAQLTRKLAALKKRIDEDPASLIGMLRVSPYMKDGRLIGVQIAPGKDATLFAQAGLRRNDVITSINGIALDNPGAATVVQDALRSSSALTIEVLRNGQPLTLMFNLDESIHDKKTLRLQ